MTIKSISETSHFLGISGDAMPNNTDEGAIFDFIDTGESYIYHDGLWEYDYRRSVSPETINL